MVFLFFLPCQVLGEGGSRRRVVITHSSLPGSFSHSTHSFTHEQIGEQGQGGARTWSHFLGETLKPRREQNRLGLVVPAIMQALRSPGRGRWVRWGSTCQLGLRGKGKLPQHSLRMEQGREPRQPSPLVDGKLHSSQGLAQPGIGVPECAATACPRQLLSQPHCWDVGPWPLWRCSHQPLGLGSGAALSRSAA